MRFTVFFAWMVLAMAPAVASDADYLAASKPGFERRRAEIEKEMNARRGDFREIDRGSRSRVLELLSGVAVALENSGGFGRLPEAGRQQVLASAEEANRLLAQAARDSSLLCHNVANTGSNMRRRECITVAEARRRSLNGGGVVIGPTINGSTAGERVRAD